MRRVGSRDRRRSRRSRRRSLRRSCSVRARSRSGCSRASGLWISLVYEPTVGLYRVEQRPARYLAITIVNVAVTIVLSATLVVTLSDKAFGLVAGSYAGTAVALLVVAVDRRTGPVRLPRSGRARPDAALRPAVRSLAAGALGAQPLEPPVPARLLDAGGRRRARARRAHRHLGRARGDGVPARVAAVRVLDRGRRGGSARVPRRAHVVVRARLVARARPRPAAPPAARPARPEVGGGRQPDGARGGRLRLLRRLLRGRRRGSAASRRPVSTGSSRASRRSRT